MRNIESCYSTRPVATMAKAASTRHVDQEVVDLLLNTLTDI